MKKGNKIATSAIGCLIGLGTFFVAFFWMVIICALIWADSETFPDLAVLIILFVPLIACLASLFAYKKYCRKRTVGNLSPANVIVPTPTAVVESTADGHTITPTAEQAKCTEIEHAEYAATPTENATGEAGTTFNAEKIRSRKNVDFLSDGRRVPLFAQLQQQIAAQKAKSVESCKAVLYKTRTVSTFIHWYDQLTTDLEDLSKLDKVRFSPPPSHQLYILNEEFQLHLCDAIVRAKEDKVAIISGKYRNSKEFQEIALTDFINDIEQNKSRFSPWNEELAKKSIEEIDNIVHPVIGISDDTLYVAKSDTPTNLPLEEISCSDDIFFDAVDVILENNQASVSMLQRKLKLGYAQSARLIDEMEEKGIVGAFQGSRPREILITGAQWKLIKQRAKCGTDADISLDFKDDIEKMETENALLKARLAAALTEKENLEKSITQERIDKMMVAKAELMTIDMMDGHDFEKWCAEALRNSGFSNVAVTSGSGDQGVDVVAEKDGLKYAVQCKRYNSDLGNTPVQEVFTGARFYNCHVCAVITNRNFTSGAKDAAAVTGVLLWGRSWILEYLYRKHGVMPEVDQNA